jgi:RNA-directed DNA polymerase|nr:hypothetical protein [Oedogonium sp. 260-2_chl]
MGAKLIAVRQVTTLNKGKNTPGIDKQIITTPEQKMQLVESLKIDGKSSPIRRVWIPKPGRTEKRPLGIPIIKDRAKQALIKLALEPEWEAIFEPNSYGFRPGRRPHDAIEAIFLALHHNRPKYVYDADIRKCFDRINHEALIEKLNTFPEMRKQISAWLKAGIMEGYANKQKTEIIPSIEGTPQGGVISPLLANIALHGLEEHLKEYVTNLDRPYSTSGRGKLVKSKATSIVRFADDFVIIHPNKSILELCVEETKIWLQKIGLTINEDKSQIKDCRNGFLFLGFQIIQLKKKNLEKFKVGIHPSRKSQTKLLSKIKGILTTSKAISSYELISILRPIIIGWANYFKYSECTNTFSRLTHYIHQKLRVWAFRRNNRNTKKSLKEKYFPSGNTYTFDGNLHKDNWILNGTKKLKDGKMKTIYLPHMSWIKSKKHVKIKGTETPFSFTQYWATRMETQSPYSTRITKLLINQKQICPICNQKFTEFDSENWEIDHIIPKFAGGKDVYSNLQLLHKDCHLQKSKNDLKSYKSKIPKPLK